MGRSKTIVSTFAGRAADRNPRAMEAALDLSRLIAARLDLQTVTIAAPEPVADGGWATQLRLARPKLTALAMHLDALFDAGRKSLLVTGRCAASIATLPVVARRHPDAAVVWFDAHGDCNTPADNNHAEAAYLGGMVISGAAGLWDTGFGGALKMANVILAGARDLDPPEIERIRTGQIGHMAPGNGFAERLRAAVGARSIYVHLDCDVLTAGLVPTEYQVAHGLDFVALRDAFEVLSTLPLLGLEIAEYEGTWPDGRRADPAPLLDAVAPLLRSACAPSQS